jgi:hypothetical protein
MIKCQYCYWQTNEQVPYEVILYKMEATTIDDSSSILAQPVITNDTINSTLEIHEMNMLGVSSPCINYARGA